MNNEPVAVVDHRQQNGVTWLKVIKGRSVMPEHNTLLYTHPVKELTREDRLKLIGTLKWAEDLLREAGHDEAVSDVQDCLMILRKAQEK